MTIALIILLVNVLAFKYGRDIRAALLTASQWLGAWVSVLTGGKLP